MLHTHAGYLKMSGILGTAGAIGLEFLPGESLPAQVAVAAALIGAAGALIKWALKEMAKQRDAHTATVRVLSAEHARALAVKDAQVMEIMRDFRQTLEDHTREMVGQFRDGVEANNRNTRAIDGLTSAVNQQPRAFCRWEVRQ
jgi:putative NADH-flavin reductase